MSDIVATNNIKDTNFSDAIAIHMDSSDVWNVACKLNVFKVNF